MAIRISRRATRKPASTPPFPAQKPRCQGDGSARGTVAIGVRLTLPYPPSVNHLYATVNGHRVLSKKGKAYAHTVWAVCLDQCLASQVAAPVRVTLYVYPPDNRRRDLDNILKAVLDSLQKAKVLNNDSDIAELHIFRKETHPPGGYLQVLLETVEL